MLTIAAEWPFGFYSLPYRYFLFFYGEKELVNIGLWGGNTFFPCNFEKVLLVQLLFL